MVGSYSDNVQYRHHVKSVMLLCWRMFLKVLIRGAYMMVCGGIDMVFEDTGLCCGELYRACTTASVLFGCMVSSGSDSHFEWVV